MTYRTGRTPDGREVAAISLASSGPVQGPTIADGQTNSYIENLAGHPNGLAEGFDPVRFAHVGVRRAVSGGYFDCLAALDDLTAAHGYDAERAIAALRAYVTGPLAAWTEGRSDEQPGAVEWILAHFT